jgi:uncharacterized protein (TIGR02145 family)
MKENLRVRKYRNGETIPTGLDNAAWESSTSGAYTFSLEKEENFENGTLYNWYSVADDRGLCPIGWHIPSDSEWTILINYLGGESVAGGKMKSIGTAFWRAPNTSATNESGFSALPSGNRYYLYDNVSEEATFWSSTESPNKIAMAYKLFYSVGIVSRQYASKHVGLSVRCLKE